MRTVRLTIWPDRVMDISDAEYVDLSRRGMVLADVAVVPAAGEPPAAVEPSPMRRRKTAPDAD
jgi:hypothetical protein